MATWLRPVLLCAVFLSLGAALSWADDGPALPSVLVLDASPKNGAVNLGGEDRLLIRKGDLIVNSSHQNAVFNANSTIQALDGQVQVVGGFSNLGQATTTPEPTTGATAVNDPLTALQYPSVSDVQSRQKLFLSGDREETLSPGYYAGGLSLTGKGLAVTMEPGLYVITDGDFFINEAQLEGTGVTIVMSGQHPGKLLWATGAQVKLSAPTEGSLKDILIVSGGTAQGNETDVGFNGAKALLRGTIYAPRGRVGAYFKSNVTVGHILCFNLMMNTGSTLFVVGAPVDDPVWEEGQ